MTLLSIDAQSDREAEKMTTKPVTTLTLGEQHPLPEINETGEFFNALSENVVTFFIEQGIDDDTARDHANALVVQLCETFQGEMLYVSKKPAVMARWIAAVRDLKHMHHRDVDRRYNWSPGYSLKVKEKLEKRLFEKQQLKLPLE